MTSFGTLCEACRRPLPEDNSRFQCDVCAKRGFYFSLFCSRDCCDQHTGTPTHLQLHLIRADPPKGITPAQSADAGRCLAATRDFAAGEIVFTDEPLVCGDTWEACVSNLYDLPDPAEAVARVRAFFGSDCEDQLEYSERRQTRLPQALQTPENLQLLQIMMNNAIEVQVIDEQRARIGFFEYGSLMNHACHDSCALRPQQSGSNCTFVAIRPIARGEIVSWNYNLPDALLWKAAEDRRDFLLDRRGFNCACARCGSSEDYLRSFRCERCKGALLNDAPSARHRAHWVCRDCGPASAEHEASTARRGTARHGRTESPN